MVRIQDKSEYYYNRNEPTPKFKCGDIVEVIGTDRSDREDGARMGKRYVVVTEYDDVEPWIPLLRSLEKEIYDWNKEIYMYQHCLRKVGEVPCEIIKKI